MDAALRAASSAGATSAAPARRGVGSRSVAAPLPCAAPRQQPQTRRCVLHARAHGGRGRTQHARACRSCPPARGPAFLRVLSRRPTLDAKS
jgi:hypothetical protein